MSESPAEVADLVGKSVLIEITCCNAGGSEVDSFQVFGHIATVGTGWIGVKRPGWSELFGLPPVPELLEAAPAGVYTLRSSGREIHDPDLLATLTVTVSDPESLLTLRGVGFVPAGG